MTGSERDYVRQLEEEILRHEGSKRERDEILQLLDELPLDDDARETVRAAITQKAWALTGRRDHPLKDLLQDPEYAKRYWQSHGQLQEHKRATRLIGKLLRKLDKRTQ